MHASASTSSLSSSDTDDEQLRSYFDGITKGCNVFRILLVGKAGSGKSTIVSEVFDFDLDNAGVQDFSAGEHDINQEITSLNNKSLSLQTAKASRSRKGRPFPEQLHAIWYCVEIPIAGQRPFESGDVTLFDSLLRMNNKVPVIVVFTKLDRLEYKEQKRIKKMYIEHGMDPKAALARAKTECVAAAVGKYDMSCVKVLQSDFVPRAWMQYCAVSIKHPETIVKLIELTKSTLSGSESLNVLWATAQMADVGLKIEMALQAGKNMYWPGLGAAMIPMKGLRRITLLTVLGRIHSDIIRIWNMKDPEEILIGANMKTMMRKLFVEPIMVPTLDGAAGSDAEASQIITHLAEVVMNPYAAIGPAITDAAKMLDDIAVATPATARVLMAYVSDLTLGMESLYWLVRPRKAKAITRQDVIHAFITYRASQQRRQVHMLIRDFIGDDNIMRSLSRNKAMVRVAAIVAKSRFNPAEAFFLEVVTPD